VWKISKHGAAQRATSHLTHIKRLSLLIFFADSWVDFEQQTLHRRVGASLCSVGGINDGK
jgi:hypothetical protein